MRKIADLRAFLTAALPFLKREPERLQLYAEEGATSCTLGGGLSFQLGYKITGQLWDFAGHPDSVFVPLLEWIGRNQPELLASFKTNPEVITWRAEVLDADKVDFEFSFNVTERCRVVKRPNGQGADVEHLPEPHQVDQLDVRRWSLWVAGDKVAEWDAPAGDMQPWPASEVTPP